MNCFIFINSCLTKSFKKTIKEIIFEARADLNTQCPVICADSGADLACGCIVPDLIIGDFDSISEKTYEYFKNRGVKFEKYPPEKDYTDFHLALEKAVELFPEITRITVFGGLARRLDQTLGNIYVAACFQKSRKIPVSLHEAETHVYISSSDVNEKLFIDEFIKKGDIVTLRPLFEEVTIRKVFGLKYKINNEKLYAFESRGTSNVAMGKAIKIEVSEGTLLAIHIEK
ncbi:MAG: thiamine diphosphokinase [Candidatus Wallbacteria bacterium]